MCFKKDYLKVSNKLGRVVRMVVDSVLYPMRKAGQMTIRKTYPRLNSMKLLQAIFDNIFSTSLVEWVLERVHETQKSDRCCYRAVFRIIKGKNMKNTIPIHVGPKFQGLVLSTASFK